MFHLSVAFFIAYLAVIYSARRANKVLLALAFTTAVLGWLGVVL